MMMDGKKVPDVHKRFYKLHMFCGKLFWSKERKVYYDGKNTALNFKFALTKEGQEQVLSQIRNDTAFLDRMGLMDYSLIVTIIQKPAGTPPGDFDHILPFAHNQPLVAPRQGHVWGYYFGIIDFLQPWTAGKKIAHCIKCTFAPKPISTIAPSAYAKQFRKHFERHVTGAAEMPNGNAASSSSSQDDPRGTRRTRFSSSGTDADGAVVEQHPMLKDIVYITEV